MRVPHRRPLLQRLTAYFLALLLTLGSQSLLPVCAQDPPSAPRLTRLNIDGDTATLYRDDYGVPHCFAETNHALFYAAGYAVAQDRLWQLDLFRRTARGTLSEILGPSALPSDLYERRHGYTDAEHLANYNQLPGETRQVLAAYRDGINAYLAIARADPDNLLPWEFHELGYEMAPWQVSDSLAIGRYMARRFGEQGGHEVQNQALLQSLSATYGESLGAAMFNDLRWLNDPDAPTTVPQESGAGPATITSATAALTLPDIAAVADALATEWETVDAIWECYGVPRKLGSYAWAISPQRSATGNALLYGGPQMYWSTPEIVYEIQLTGGDGFDVKGISFAGMPLVLIGANRDVAWSITTGIGDNTDTFVEMLNPSDPDEYWFQDQWQAMETFTATIAIHGQSEPVVETIRRTVHGPVVYYDTINDLAYSLQRAHWMQEQAMLPAFLDMMRAEDPSDLEATVAAHTVTNNFVYADRAGNIAYWQGGFVPLRADGQSVGRLPWLGDGTEEWQETNRGLPHVVNPQQGYVANWNNKPSVDFDNGDARQMGRQDRVQDIQDLIEAQETISLDDMRTIPKEIGAYLDLGNETRYVRDYLLSAIDSAALDDAQLHAASLRLAAWDGKMLTDVVSSTMMVPEYTIWHTWLDQMRIDTFGDELGTYWSETNLNTLLHSLDAATSGVPPSRDYFDNIYTAEIETADELMVDAMLKTLQSLEASYGTADIDSWVEPRPVLVLRHALGEVVATIPASNRATYGQIIELGPNLSGENILPLGQSGFINADGVHDAHFSDQADLYRQFDYKPMLLMSLTIQHLPIIMKGDE